MCRFARGPYSSMKNCAKRIQPYCPALLLLLTSLPVYAAALSVPNQVAGPGQVVLTSADFSSQGQTVSGLQFDVQWDQALDLKLVVGDALRQSTKLLFTAPMGTRALRCLIIGMNQDAVPDGQLFKVLLIVDPNAAPGSAQVVISNAVATDPNGRAVPLEAPTASVQIQSGSPVSVALPVAGVLNAASLTPGPVSPGEIITLFGNLPDPAPRLLFGGVPAPILYAGSNQVNAIVPFGVPADAPVNLRGAYRRRFRHPHRPGRVRDSGDLRPGQCRHGSGSRSQPGPQRKLAR